MTTLTVNQKKCELDVDPTTPLLWVREKLNSPARNSAAHGAVRACNGHLEWRSGAVRGVTPLSRRAGKKVINH